MDFAAIVATSERVAATSKKLEKQAILAETIRALPAGEIDPAVNFLAGVMRQGRIGVGWAGARTEAPAAAAPSLQIAEVDAAFSEIASARGAGSNKKRAAILTSVLSRATQAEQNFIARLLIGELRQGALESLVLDAIAKAAGIPPAIVRRARMVAADLGAVARAALLEGEAGLSRFSLQLFSPVQPMLAQTANHVSEVFERFSPAAFELKLDGARVQVHKSGSTVRVFSRRLNEVTERIPEIIDAVAKFPANELILDGEAIALSEDGAPLPFQVTMTRFGRKLEVDRMREELPLRFFFFDILRLEDETLLGAPLRDRIEALARAVPEPHRVPRLITADIAEAEKYLSEVLDRGHEGLMAKSLDAPYEAGNRGSGWLKIKAVHTLDLVVLAVEWGSGRREGRLSNLHLGARDPVNGGFVMLGKTFKGMTDEMLKWQTQKLLELETRRENQVVFVRPELVVEIAIGDVQSSTNYPGGVALRFARVKRYRTDKTPAEADTIETVRALKK